MMEFKHIKIQSHGKVEVLTISNPSSLNALNEQFFTEFNEVIDSYASSHDQKVIIITGEGKAFVAGADISEMKGFQSKEGLALSERGQKIFTKLEKLKHPVIAAINGFALGGGFELALACDFRFASTKAKIGFPEVSLGLIPGYGGTQRLSRLSNLGNALFLEITGEMIDATEALRMNIVQKVFEPEELIEKSIEIANKILEKGPTAVQVVKKTIRDGFFGTINEGFLGERIHFGKLFELDGVEGISAFLEKRKPNW